jgi:hypothetical protein
LRGSELWEVGKMKNFIKIAVLMVITGTMALSGGCFFDDDYDDHHDVVYVYDTPPVADPYFNTLDVGLDCGCGDLCGCGFTDVDYSIDVMELSSYDWDLIDLQFAFTLTNWGAFETPVWVMLCDELGCEDVVVVNLLPGEVYTDSVINPVLDTLMLEFDDCLAIWGDACYMEYEIEVYLGEDCVCSPITMDYYYEGFYL